MHWMGGHAKQNSFIVWVWTALPNECGKIMDLHREVGACRPYPQTANPCCPAPHIRDKLPAIAAIRDFMMQIAPPPYN